MDTLFVWIVIFAGAAIVLLGIFLVASEKELKVKRREIEELLTRLESSQGGLSPTEPGDRTPDDSAELTQLRAVNRELQNQLTAVSGKLELSRRSIDELRATQDEGARANAEHLRAENNRLQAEIADLKNRIQANGTPGSSDDQQSEYARLQGQLSDLRTRLSESDAQLRDLEILREKLALAEAQETRRSEERVRLQSRVGELEQQLAAAREQLRELAVLRDRLAESEREQQALRDENQRRLAALQAPYSHLLNKQAELAQRQSELREELASFARLIANAADENSAVPPASSSPDAGEFLSGNRSA